MTRNLSNFPPHRPTPIVRLPGSCAADAVLAEGALWGPPVVSRCRSRLAVGWGGRCEAVNRSGVLGARYRRPFTSPWSRMNRSGS